MKYRGIVLLKTDWFPAKACCELLKISCSGFYDWVKRRPSKRKERDGEKIGKNKVDKLMKKEGLSAKKKKAFRPKTTINNPNTNYQETHSLGRNCHFANESIEKLINLRRECAQAGIGRVVTRYCK